jgi:hypothetical protein
VEPLEIQNVPGIKLHPQSQIWVYGAEAARAEENEWRLANNITSLDGENEDEIIEDADYIDSIVQMFIAASGANPPAKIFLKLPKWEGLVLMD